MEQVADMTATPLLDAAEAAPEAVAPRSRQEFEIVEDTSAPVLEAPVVEQAPVVEAPPPVVEPVQPAPAQPAPVVPIVTPEELAELRSAKEQRDNFARAMDDPEVAIPYLKKLKADGLKRDPNFTLLPELEVMIAPKTAAPTRAQVIAKIKELKEAGDYDQAYQIEEEYITRPAAAAAANAVMTEREQKQAAINQREQARQNTVREWESLHTSYPELVEKSDKYQIGFQIKDAAVRDKMIEVQRTEAPGATMGALMTLALVKLGRWGGGQQVPKQVKTSTQQLPTKMVARATNPKNRTTYEVVE